jgi:hypothetical protein
MGNIQSATYHWEAKAKRSSFRQLDKKNKFPHRLGPGGYKAKVDESSKKDEEAHASGLPPLFPYAKTHTKWWLLGQAKKTKDGQYVLSDTQINDVVDKVKELVELEKAGQFNPVGPNDQLTAAFGNEEHRGRTQSVSSIAPWKLT